jgi:hypothetical protein
MGKPDGLRVAGGVHKKSAKKPSTGVSGGFTSEGCSSSSSQRDERRRLRLAHTEAVEPLAKHLLYSLCLLLAGLEFHKSKGQHILKNPMVVQVGGQVYCMLCPGTSADAACRRMLSISSEDADAADFTCLLPQAIVDKAGIKSTDVVLEIGPGEPHAPHAS